jgi:signal transduction histidine kinase
VVWCLGRRDSSGVEGLIDVTEDCTEHGGEERRGEENGQSAMSAII